MKIHLRQIPAVGLHLEGEENCPIPELETEDVRCAGSLHYALDLGTSAAAFWASGTLSQPVELRCVRCLDRFKYEIKVNSFAAHTELPGPEMIDLTPAMREDILLNLPAHPHCDREGGHVCPAAERLEIIAEGAQTIEKRKPDWSALDELKLRS